MTWDVVLAAFVITTLSVVFGAVPIYCLVWASDVFGRSDRRASDNSRNDFAPDLPQGTSRDVVENDGVLKFRAQRVPSRLDRAVLAEKRVDQLAS